MADSVNDDQIHLDSVVKRQPRDPPERVRDATAVAVVAARPRIVILERSMSALTHVHFAIVLAFADLADVVGLHAGIRERSMSELTYVLFAIAVAYADSYADLADIVRLNTGLLEWSMSELTHVHFARVLTYADSYNEFEVLTSRVAVDCCNFVAFENAKSDLEYVHVVALVPSLALEMMKLEYPVVADIVLNKIALEQYYSDRTRVHAALKTLYSVLSMANCHGAAGCADAFQLVQMMLVQENIRDSLSWFVHDDQMVTKHLNWAHIRDPIVLKILE